MTIGIMMGLRCARFHTKFESASRSCFLMRFISGLWFSSDSRTALATHSRASTDEVVVVETGNATHGDDRIGRKLAALEINGNRHACRALARHGLTIAQDVCTDIAHRGPVNVDDAALDAFATLDLAVGHHEGIAVFENEDVIGVDTDGLGQTRMGTQVRGLAMDRQEVLGIDEREHELELLGTRMPRNVHKRTVLIPHVGAYLGELVDDARDRLLVAGNGVAEMMTVSPRSISMVLCSPTDMRARADNGSPWLPVQSTTVFSGG